MPTPSGALATLRPDLGGSLEKFDLENQMRGYIAPRVLPVIESDKQSGTYGVIPIDQLNIEVETRRTGKSGYSRSGFTFDDATFSCDEHGHEVPVDDRDAAIYGDYFSAELIAAKLARDRIHRNLEKRAAAAVFNTTTWTGAALYTDVATTWATIATSAPVTNVLAASLLVRNNCGMIPDTLICSYSNFLYLIQSAQIIDRLGSAGAGKSYAAGDITTDDLARVLRLKQVLVAGATKNSANEGVAYSGATIWSDSYAMVCVSGGAGIKDIGIGHVVHWGKDGSSIGGTVETYRDEVNRADIVRARMDIDEIIKYPEAGHLLKVD